MRLPRDMDATTLVRALARVGYAVTRQSGSHLRLTTTGAEQHHITIPNHDPIKVGTLASILSSVASHMKIDKSELLRRLQI